MIAFDLQAVQSRSHADRGIARFCMDLVRAIERIDPDHIDLYLVNPDRPMPALLEPLIRAGKVRRSDELGAEPLRLLHLGSPVELDVPVEQMLVGTPDLLVANLYDLIPLVFPDRYLTDLSARMRYRARLGLYGAADLVLADSQSAADDAVRLLDLDPARCRVIGAGAADVFCPAHPSADPTAIAMAGVPNLRPGFVLVPTGVDWRKNFDGVIDAYGRLDRATRTAHQLVLVCKASDAERADFMAHATAAGCADSVLMTGFVSDDLLVSLYQAAHLVVLPSRYEGFGLPVLEARRCGALVVAGDNSSLRELVTDPAARFDADDVDDMANVIAMGVQDEDFRRRLERSPMPPFSWDAAAAVTLEAHRELLQRPRVRMLLRPRLPRIAYVSPLPPVESGIAHYSFDLVTALARIADVQVFTDQPFDRAQVPPGVELGVLADLRSRAAVGEFDHVVYALGNNVLHHGALQMLRHVPGVVHLHDVRLVNCYADEPWPEIVEEHYPGRYSSDDLLSLMAPWSPTVASRGVFLLDDVGRHAQSILVHSRHAAELVSLDLGRDVQLVGPLACRPRPEGRLPESDLVVSLGIVAESKQSWKVAAAASFLPEVRVAFVGDGSLSMGGHGDNVIGTGRVDSGAYDSWLRRAALAVQLRGTSNGESSAAVSDCLSLGVPLVVSDIGSFAELPAEIVHHVPVDITAERLADVVRELLSNSDRLAEMAAASLRYAQANSYDVAAKRLLDALEDPPSLRSRLAG